ncbi:MAG: hypothetical protein K6T55_05540 [Syntrophobacterales bacterium]|nr:hypothetical protein [Syntrophobacterales bacterium]
MRWRKVLGLMAVTLGLLVSSSAPGLAAPARQIPEVRQVGLSRVGGQTLLTVVLSRPAAPRITPVDREGSPQLVVEFPQVRAGRLPATLAGDEVLVSRALTRVGAGGTGVTITLELVPGRPYTWWRQSRPGSGAMALFVVGLRAEGRATAAPSARTAPSVPPPPTPHRAQMAPLPGEPEELEEEPGREWQPTPAPSFRESLRGDFAELRRLAPQGQAVWQYLERSGWRVSTANDYDRPGVRASRAFTLTHASYPEVEVNVVHLPGNAAGTPNITLLDLSFNGLKSVQAAKYREMRTWSFAKIRQNFEDIGDFFDDALKPIRVELRKECQSLALRYAPLLQEFVRQVVPRDPKAPETVMNHIKAKVSPRFEGVQYTISEEPLLILNLVDFLYLRTYYVGGSGG